MGERLDKSLVVRGFVSTRSQASVLIKKGSVLLNQKKVLKPGASVSDLDQIEILESDLYVSRGAYKLVHAIDKFNLDLQGKIIADCGASTGGFTEVSLLNGASKVYAIDVGHDQINSKLKRDPRVINMEGVNLKHELALPEKVDFCVADLSFISIRLVFQTMLSFLKSNGACVLLIKPQFEAGRERLGKGGIVKESIRAEVLAETLDWFIEVGHPLDKVIESPIKGKDGNVEYLGLVSL